MMGVSKIEGPAERKGLEWWQRKKGKGSRAFLGQMVQKARKKNPESRDS